MNLYNVAEKAIDMGINKVVIIDRWKGRPGRMRFFEVKDKLSSIPPLLYIRGVKFRRDFKVKGRLSPNVFIEDSESTEIKRLSEMFSKFFELPKVKLKKIDDLHRFTVMRLASDSDDMIRISFFQMPENVEVGPRVRISHVVWEI